MLFLLTLGCLVVGAGFVLAHQWRSNALPEEQAGWVVDRPARPEKGQR